MGLFTNLFEFGFAYRHLLVIVDEFVNKTLGCFAEVMGIQKVTFILYRPEANGLCEWAKRKVIEAVRVTVGEDDMNWDKYLDAVRHSIKLW